jgi:23S rRNA (adenine2030-N6)-methyltransferase
MHLRGKATPFRVIDIHAGAGLYDLASDEAGRTGEWRDGIARLFDAALPAEAGALLAPYLAAVRSFNPDGALLYYPGSPLLVGHFLLPERPGCAKRGARISQLRKQGATADGVSRHL